MFEKVSRSLKYDSNIFFVHKHIYIHIYVDTTTDHFTPLMLRVRGNKFTPFMHDSRRSHSVWTSDVVDSEHLPSHLKVEHRGSSVKRVSWHSCYPFQACIYITSLLLQCNRPMLKSWVVKFITLRFVCNRLFLPNKYTAKLQNVSQPESLLCIPFHCSVSCLSRVELLREKGNGLPPFIKLLVQAPHQHNTDMHLLK